MAHGKTWGPERTLDPSGVTAGAIAMHAPRQGWIAAHPHWLLLIVFLGLQIADIVTTNHALAIPGVSEANPLMALAQARLGTAWWLPKVSVIGLVCFTTPLTRRRWPMIVAIAIYTAAVTTNLAHL